MNKHKYRSTNILSLPYTYKANYPKVNPSSEYRRTAARELMTLRKSVPIHFDSSVFVLGDKKNLGVMKAMVTGPDNTPYDSGCFVFDIMCPTSYPDKPPKVTLITIGPGVRFNPNLYANGYVCLSILGTWQGRAGETWMKGESSIHQVLVSIQSLILVPEPYFNEPGHEARMQTDAAKLQSKSYSEERRLYTLQYAIRDQIKSPQHGFEEVIRDHFKHKKEYVLKLCKAWTDSCFSSNKKEFEKVSKEIADLLK